MSESTKGADVLEPCPMMTFDIFALLVVLGNITTLRRLSTSLRRH